ncbi:hypothetical protein BCAR13_1840015 [Paraburkholderia caribensis]|nr:hypothetical protein BCAR13_1840015 [Paraburkholderia caribensis]
MFCTDGVPHMEVVCGPLPVADAIPLVLGDVPRRSFLTMPHLRDLRAALWARLLECLLQAYKCHPSFVAPSGGCGSTREVRRSAVAGRLSSADGYPGSASSRHWALLAS